MWLTLFMAAQSSALATAPSQDAPALHVFMATQGAHDIALPKTARRQLGENAHVFPASDLQQSGRSRAGASGPVDLKALSASLATIEATPTAADHTDALLEIEASLGFVDDPALLAPLFRTWVQLSRAESETDQDDLFITIGEERVSRHGLQAAGLLSQSPHLDQSLSAGPAADEVRRILSALQQGDIPMMNVCFATGGERFDAAAFAASYRLYVNGAEIVVTDPEGMVALPPLRNDIHLVRPSSASISKRITLNLKDDMAYFALDAAQRVVSRQVIDAVATATDSDTATLPDTLIASLEHYRTRSGQAQIVMALDPSGDDRKSKIELWTYSPEDALLVRGGPAL